MKIAVIGAGVMGCIYGGPLSEKNEVLLVDVVKAHIEAINEHGLKIVEPDGAEHIYKKCRAADSTVSEPPSDLIILLCKGYQTRDALLANAGLIGDNTVIVSLQNGYGNSDEIENFVPAERIVLGTSAHGGIMEAPGLVFHAGKGATHLGCPASDQSRAELAAALFREAGIEDVELSADVKRLVWSKLFVNCGINPVTALIGDTNQCVANNPFAREAAALLVKEAVGVANASGMGFDFGEEFENVIKVALGTGPNRSSMLADVSNKRLTEIDRINGAVVSEAKKLGLEAPLNETITKLIHAKERLYRAE